MIASVPNIRNLATSDIAGGRFEYQPNGVLDITHVRFFTRSSLRDLFEQTGFDVRRLEPLTRAVGRRSRDRQSSAGRVETRTLSIAYQSFEDLEDLYALQYVIDARPANAVAPATA